MCAAGGTKAIYPLEETVQGIISTKTKQRRLRLKKRKRKRNEETNVPTTGSPTNNDESDKKILKSTNNLEVNVR